jgi:hypothetical protein
MSTALELVYQYRQLSAKCEGDAGLDLDEIELFATLEQLIDSSTQRPVAATLRASRFADRITVAVLGREGAICVGCDHVEDGQLVELRFEDEELSLSYRFAARVDWTRHRDDATLDVGLRWEGAPVLVRKISFAHDDEIAITEAA